MALPNISIIIPAFNEEACLPRTLSTVRAAVDYLQRFSGGAAEVIVVDNESTDATPRIGADMGASVVREEIHNVARVRNTGARAARYELLMFLDADTTLPPELLARIVEEMSNPGCDGGAVEVRFDPKRLGVRIYLAVVRFVNDLTRMRFGACQFCRRQVFDALGGYDERIFMGEDVDFMWRVQWAARRRGHTTSFIGDIAVNSSSRRWDQWPLWRTMMMTHPLIVFGLRRYEPVWRRWYDKDVAPR